MNIVLIMIPLSIVLLIGAAAAFFWAVDNDQFEDMETPGMLPLDDNPSDNWHDNPRIGSSVDDNRDKGSLPQ